ncbi:MAG: hypothetical protein LIO77_01825 [Rikenellaceae bacterium]|nr:hypothetical protein [Rikenellaceae bacterium]
MVPRLLPRYFLLVFSLLAALPLYSQEDPGHVSFARFVRQVESRTGWSVAYIPKEITPSVSAYPDIGDMSAQEALWKVLDSNDYDLVVSGKHIIIKKRPRKEDPYKATPVIDPELMVERIPPPRQSVFSGETRLIIIRRDSTAPHQISVPLVSRSTAPTDTISSRPAVRDIPFRSDLLQGEAYGNQEQTRADKTTRRSRKRN